MVRTVMARFVRVLVGYGLLLLILSPLLAALWLSGF